MKKQLLLLTSILFIVFPASAQRFLTQVFPSYSETANIMYASNYSVLSGTPTLDTLMMDVYQPSGAADTMAHRPLIIFLHEGALLPPYINEEPVGSRNDSANVAMCSQFAQRGYVVANIDYRLGWNPAGSTVDIRKGTIITAVWRAIQDAKACVRYFRKDAATANLYKIDSDKIILGGAAAGGIIAVGFATLQDSLQIDTPAKFISSTSVPEYGYVAGYPYISPAVLGDQNGYGGIPALNNSNNSPGYGNSVQFVFTMGADIGDSAWMTSAAPPMVAFHEMTNPFAPYGDGIVYVPSIPPQTVMAVSGSSVFIPAADELGNNNCFNNATFKDAYASDPYTIQANSLNGGNEGLYPFATPVPESSPWDWYDSLVTVETAEAYGLSAGAADTVYANSLITNPGMSKSKAMLYIDTIMGYLNPRIAYCLNLVPGLAVNGITAPANRIDVFPNPASDQVIVKANGSDNLINEVKIIDITGRIVRLYDDLNTQQFTMDKGNISSGVYFISVYSASGITTKKLVIQ